MSNSGLIKEKIAAEYSRCLADPVYFIRKYCYIQHPTRGRIKFDLYPFQEDVLKQLLFYDKNIILKSRQLGISTLSAGYSLWYAMFHRDKNILVVATKQGVAKNLVTKVREMYAFLPNWLKQQMTTDSNNKMSIRFKNGSEIKAVSSASDSGRSEALSLLIIDEAAFVQHVEELWASVQPTLSTGGKAIILSTPNGVGNLFHKLWMGAEQGDNGINPIKLHWTVHPERDQNWRDQQTLELGERLASQECDVSFVSSGHTLIPGELLEKYRTTMLKEPIEKRGYEKEFWLWELPDYSKDYMVVADVARGDGGDYSAFHVIDIENLKQVGEYKGHLPPDDFGHFLVNVATEFNDALLVIENANVGWGAIQVAIDRDYKNLYYSDKDLKVLDTDVQLIRGADLKDKTQMTPGFTTSSRTRPLIISKLERYFREEVVTIYSKRLINELQVFIWLNGKAQAQNGYNDDLVMSFAIGMWVRDMALELKQRGLQLTKRTLDYMGNSYSKNPSLSVYTNNRQNNPWVMNIPGAGTENLTNWI